MNGTGSGGTGVVEVGTRPVITGIDLLTIADGAIVAVHLSADDAAAGDRFRGTA